MSGEVERHLRAMHVHFARGVYRWIAPRFDDGTDWEAEAHFRMAALRLEDARLEQDAGARG